MQERNGATTFEEAAEAIIKKIRDTRGEEVTKQEKMIRYIMAQPGNIFTMEQLAPFFAGTESESRRLAEQRLADLNRKFRKFGYEIVAKPREYGVSKFEVENKIGLLYE